MTPKEGSHGGALAVALQRLARRLLALAAAVDVGGVEEVDARIERAVDDVSRVCRGRPAPEHHAAKAQAADLHACAAQRSKFHRLSLPAVQKVGALCHTGDPRRTQGEGERKEEKNYTRTR